MDKKIKDTLAQASYWAYAAWTFPFVALAVLTGEILIGNESWMGRTAITVVVTFIITSVFWWWWAISKIVYMVNAAQRVEENFSNLSKEIKEIKKDVGNREWRNSDFD